MAETTYFPRRLILAGAMISGVLLALAVHMLGARYGLDLGGLWRSDTGEFMPAGAAVAWWLIASVGFSGGYFTASLMDSAVSGQIPQRMQHFLIGVGVLVLVGAGQAAAAPSPIPTISGVLAGLAALCLGALVAFCGAHLPCARREPAHSRLSRPHSRSLRIFRGSAEPDRCSGREQQARRDDQRPMRARHEGVGLPGQRAEQRDTQHAAGLPGRVEYAGGDAGARFLNASEQR